MRDNARDQLGNRPMTVDAARLRPLMINPSAPIPGGSTDHGALAGLSDDDHIQYLHVSAGRLNITAQHQFAPTLPQPPFSLGANAQNQTVTGLRADSLNKSVSTGNGLTGGGDLTADRTLSVLLGTGLAFSGSNIVLDFNGNPAAIQPDASTSQGVSLYAARMDHVHAITADPAGTIAAGDTASEGVSTAFSRADHRHAISVGTPVNIAPDDAASEGVLTTFSRSDHRHGITAAAAGNLTPDASAAEGVATSFARSDHAHGAACAAPGADSVNLSASSEGSGANFARADHTHNLDEGIAPTWTGAHKFTVRTDMELGTEQLRLAYNASNYASFIVGSDGSLTITPTGGLTLNPTGDITFDPAGNDLLPLTNYDLNLGAINKKYLTLHCAELWVETLVAQSTIATIGGRILVGPTTVLTSDLAAGAAPSTITTVGATSATTNTAANSITINKHASCAIGDAMIAHIAFRSDAATITPPTGWTLIRNETNTAPTPDLRSYVYAKTAGASEPASYTWNFSESVHAAGGIYTARNADTGTWIDVQSAATSASDTNCEAGTVTTTVDNTKLVCFASSAVNNQAVTPAGSFGESWDVTTTSAANGVSSEGARLDQAAAGSSGAVTPTLGTASASIGQLVALTPRTRSTVSVKHNQMIPLDIGYMEADGKVEFYRVVSGPTGTGPYDYVVERNLDGSGSNAWYAGDALFNTGQATNGFIDLYSLRGVKVASQYGPAIAGNVRSSQTYNDWAEHWAIGNLNGLYGYGATTYGAAMGKYANGQSFLTADATNGIRILQRAASVNTTVAQWAIDGSILIGQAAVNQSNVFISAGAVKLRNNTTDVISLLASANAAGQIATFDGVIGITASGGIYQGTGTFASPTTGLKLYNSSGVGTIESYDSGNKLVTLGVTGIKLISSPSYSSVLAWVDADGVEQERISVDTTTVSIGMTGGYLRLDLANGDLTFNFTSHGDLLTAKHSDSTFNVAALNGAVRSLAAGISTPVATLGNIYAENDIIAKGGLYVGGNTSSDPAAGTITTTGDIIGGADGRLGGGLYVGATNVDPAAGNIVATGDIYTTAWTDYSSTSTITGWVSRTTTKIYYKKIGKTVLVQFYLEGTSNATTVSFTLPFSQQANVAIDMAGGACQDNGSWQATPCEISLAASASTVNVYKAVPSVAWTNTGTKTAIGMFFYESA